ncbi:MAG: S1-like domain-containing RNA-binding protein [Porticoccaceae bacterium]|nr:S1-like domain-containing RNA-binding protein [Porticoccaceae bacterium]
MTIDIGKLNKLQVVKIVDFGVYLDGDEAGTILLPKRYVPDGLDLDDWVEVFLYFDSEDQLIATTDTPKALAGSCELLKVIDTNPVGAFLDWGLPKDLLVPFSEQQHPMKEGQSYMVYVFHDLETDRILASSKLNHYLEEESLDLEPKQAVDLRVSDKTELGYKAIINNQYLGLIFHGDAFRPLAIGERLPGYIKAIREDGKIDLNISQHSSKGDNDLENQILEYLKSSGGQSNLTDKSDPDHIYRQFKVSKKKYKNALGALYKRKLIVIAADKISLVQARKASSIWSRGHLN